MRIVEFMSNPERQCSSKMERSMAELLLRAAAALTIVAGLIYLSGHLLRKAQAPG